MRSSITTYLVAGLAATTSVVATPLPSDTQPKSTLTTSTIKAAATAAPSSSFPPPGPAAPPADPALLAALATAPNNVKRYEKILNDSVPLKFNFNSGPNVGKGGKVVVASRANFAPLVSTNIASAMGFLEPCGMNTLHTHPRAAEFLTVVQGTVQTGFILENPLTTQFNTTLNQFEGTVFPQGSIHFQFNPTCAPAIFVAGLNNEDPGASQLAQNILAVQDDVLEATFGFQEPIRAGEELAKFRKAVPANVALGIKSCVEKCGLGKVN